MSRTHGRNAALYMNVTSGGTAEPIVYLSSFSLDFAPDHADVTALGDTNHVYVSGLPDASGSFSGFYDNATPQTYTAATDGVARKFYAYADRTVPGSYWFGTFLPTFQVSFDVGGGANISGTYRAASQVQKVG